MADDKKCSDILLERAGFPVPKSVYIAFDDADDISSVVAGLRFPLVVKPVDGAHGEGVVTNITDLKKLTTVAQATLKKSRRIIVQEHVAGHEFRVLVLL